MERERITISIKKSLLQDIDKTIDGVAVRNRSHAFETLAKKALGNTEIDKAVILLGGDNAMSYIPAAKEYLLFLRNAGFSEVFIAVGFLADKIKQKIGNGEEFGLKIKYVEKGEGSGGALSSIKSALKNTFVVVNAEEFHQLDFGKLVEYHNKFGNTATVATDDIESMSGFYILSTNIFEYIPKGFSMLEGDIFPKLLDKNEIVVFPVVN